MSESTDERVNSLLLKARMLGLGLVVAPAIYLLMGFILLREGGTNQFGILDSNTAKLLFAALGGVGIMMGVLAMLLRSGRLNAAAARGRVNTMDDVERYVITWTCLTHSLGEIIAILGLVGFFLTGAFDKLIIFACIGIAFGVALFPSRARIEAIAATLNAKGDDAWGPSQSD